MGVVTVTAAGCHHTGALATYLHRATQRGLLAILSCSGPATATVAPHGGTRGVFGPNPLAVGIPTSTDPVLVDISASITTNNRARQLAERGERFPALWAQDREGELTDDPDIVTRGGTLLPVGGVDHGHKGFGLALAVEALTQGLSGFGRRDAPSGVLMNVFLQLIDPAAFGGQAAFLAESDWLVQACRASPPRQVEQPVRLPGEHAHAQLRTAQTEGVPIADATAQVLQELLAAHSITWPAPVQAAH